jgi:4-hydroxy-3-methylbut-2-en-1-yl diphosphate reductase
MNRTLRLLRRPAAECCFGQVLVAATFDDPERGLVNSAAAPLIAAVLSEGRSRVGGRGPRIRLGPVCPAEPGAHSRAGGVLFAVSYVDRNGTAGGFALAAHNDDEAGMAVASRAAREWMGAVRSRRLLMEDRTPLCWGGLRAVRLARESAADGPVRILGYPVADGPSLEGLRHLGVACDDDLRTVPDDSQVLIPAHGASPMARAVAAARGLRVVDATCPLVAAVHADAAAYADRGDLVAVIGRAGDAAVRSLAPRAREAGRPQARGTVVVVQTAADVSRLEWADADRVSFVIDPAMPAADAMPVLAALRARFPGLRGHHLDVMCDHGSDQVQAIAAVAADSELTLILAGTSEDADTPVALRAAERAGSCPRVVRRLADLSPELLASATSVGLVATLGAPPGLAERIAGALSGLGPLTVSRRSVRTRQATPGDSGTGSGPGNDDAGGTRRAAAYGAARV